MKKQLRIGVLGGIRGLDIARAIGEKEAYTVTAIADVNPAARERVTQKIPFPVTVCETFDDLLRSGVDVVILANFFHEHCKYAIRAMEAGVDVLSDTTAAPTPGDCLDLIECCERTGRKYFLAANCTVMPGPAELCRRYRSGELGEVQYAEAEYFHPAPNGDEEAFMRQLYPTEYHWRRYLPQTYYNMHSLGVLMAITGLLPRRVTAMEIHTKNYADSIRYRKVKTSAGISLCEMENGAIFRTTGWASLAPSGKWFRLTCDRATVETERTNQDRVLFRPFSGTPDIYDPEGYTEEEKRSTHGGADARLFRVLAEAVLGKETDVPLLDVYGAAALSLAGIYGFYSILDGKTHDIPDVRDASAREVLRGDYRSPFPDENGNTTLPCTAFPGR